MTVEFETQPKFGGGWPTIPPKERQPSDERSNGGREKVAKLERGGERGGGAN